jgi:hypothetical protein
MRQGQGSDRGRVNPPTGTRPCLRREHSTARGICGPAPRFRSRHNPPSQLGVIAAVLGNGLTLDRDHHAAFNSPRHAFSIKACFSTKPMQRDRHIGRKILPD